VTRILLANEPGIHRTGPNAAGPLTDPKTLAPSRGWQAKITAKRDGVATMSVRAFLDENFLASGWPRDENGGTLADAVLDTIPAPLRHSAARGDFLKT
jgi:hypothetical protein